MKDNNIIDLSRRRMQGREQAQQRMKDFKLRIDVEQAKTLVSTSLISILFLAVFANHSLLNTADSVETGNNAIQMSSRAPASDRGLASIPTGTSDWEDELVRRLSREPLKGTSSIGRAPSVLESLAVGFLEGKYAVRLNDGKLQGVEFSDSVAAGEFPKEMGNREVFLEKNRDLLPVEFKRLVKAESRKTTDDLLIESYELYGDSVTPAAKVEFKMDGAGRLLAMRVLR